MRSSTASRLNEKLTDAGDATASAVDTEQRPSYEPTLPGYSCLVFPGPKMRVETHIVGAGGREYALRGVFAIEFRDLEDGIVEASHRSMPVQGYGASQEEAVAEFCDAFDFQWRNLVEVDEATLTAGGVRRRNLMQAAVEKVIDNPQ